MFRQIFYLCILLHHYKDKLMNSKIPALDDIRVLDCSRVMAGPYCTMLLGDYGADVIKVEQPEIGDPTRHWGPPWLNEQSAYFLSCNRNKRSITIDIKRKDGQKIIKDLVKNSDIFVENFKVGYLKKLGLDYQNLIKINPKLIFCSITGYGQTGPYKDESGYDLMIQAQGGLMSITGLNEPVKVGVPIVDITTGINACNAILMALFYREKSGQGQYIDCSLLDNQLSLLTNVAQNYFVSKSSPKRYGNAHPNIVPYQSFNCKDGQVIISVGSDDQYKRFSDYLGHTKLNQAKFKTNDKRVKNRIELISILESVTKKMLSKTIIKNLKKLQIPCARINSVPEIFADSQVINRQMIVEINHPVIGQQKQIGSAVKLSKTAAQIRFAPPLLSEHSKEILLEICHYSNDEILALISSKVI